MKSFRCKIGLHKYVYVEESYYTCDHFYGAHDYVCILCSKLNLKGHKLKQKYEQKRADLKKAKEIYIETAPREVRNEYFINILK